MYSNTQAIDLIKDFIDELEDVSFTSISAETRKADHNSKAVFVTVRGFTPSPKSINIVDYGKVHSINVRIDVAKDPRPQDVLYANITKGQKAAIVAEFERALAMGADRKQAISIAAHSGFGLTDQQWNTAMGDNAFASACAVLVMAGKLN